MEKFCVAFDVCFFLHPCIVFGECSIMHTNRANKLFLLQTVKGNLIIGMPLTVIDRLLFPYNHLGFPGTLALIHGYQPIHFLQIKNLWRLALMTINRSPAILRLFTGTHVRVTTGEADDVAAWKEAWKSAQVIQAVVA